MNKKTSAVSVIQFSTEVLTQPGQFIIKMLVKGPLVVMNVMKNMLSQQEETTH